MTLARLLTTNFVTMGYQRLAVIKLYATLALQHQQRIALGEIIGFPVKFLLQTYQTLASKTLLSQLKTLETLLMRRLQ